MRRDVARRRAVPGGAPPAAGVPEPPAGPPAGQRLVLDGTRCDAHGICALKCPERIGLDEWGYAVLDSSPVDDAVTAARARRAVAACPEGALSLAAVVGAATVRS